MHVPGKRKSQMVRESEKQGATTRHPSEWKREKKPENGGTCRSEPSAAYCTKPARACGAHSVRLERLFTVRWPSMRLREEMCLGEKTHTVGFP